MRQYTERFSQQYGLFVYSITSISSIRIKLMVSVRQPSYNVYHDRHTNRTTAVIQRVWRSPHNQYNIKKREPLRCDSLNII